MAESSKGVILVDVGTPRDLSKKAVQDYLNEFLGDPFVIRGPQWIREILFKRIIIPLRASKSLEKYQRIWSPEGSPLRIEIEKVSELLQVKLQSHRQSHRQSHLQPYLQPYLQLKVDEPSIVNESDNIIKPTDRFVESNNDWLVRFAFHYGGPSIESVMQSLTEVGVKELIIVPLYPQWALSTRGSLEDRFNKMKSVGGNGNESYAGFSKVSMTPVFYDNEGFLEAQSQLLKSNLPEVIDDEVAIVFSFHGLPQSHIRAVTPNCKTCLKREGECRPNPKSISFCYRYQCFETARQISSKAGLLNWDVAFQSRLGPMRWLEPSLLEVTDNLLEQGVKTMIVQCPSFVADCLETIDEVGQELMEYFLRKGGKQFILVPALNHSEVWLNTLEKMITKQIGVNYEVSSSPSSTTSL